MMEMMKSVLASRSDPIMTASSAQGMVCSAPVSQTLTMASALKMAAVSNTQSDPTNFQDLPQSDREDNGKVIFSFIYKDM